MKCLGKMHAVMTDSQFITWWYSSCHPRSSQCHLNITDGRYFE